MNNKQKKEQDTIVFMTAYKINRVKKKLPRLDRKRKLTELLAECHLSVFALNNVMQTQKGRVRYSIEFDKHKQLTQFKFDNSNDDVDSQELMDEMLWALSLSHSMKLLLDEYLFEFFFFASMERFLVIVNSRLLQVDPIVFCLNDVVFVHFELICFKTGIPLRKDEILGRPNNYNTIPVDSMRYFNEEKFMPDNRKISDIIFDNLYSFSEKLMNHKFLTTSINYLHNTLVLSNDIINVENYFMEVIGAEKIQLTLNNLSTNTNFEYYSADGLGVVTSIVNEIKHQSLSDCQLLEALKMYFFVKQYANFIDTENLSETVSNQMYIDRLNFIHGTPIITLNVLDNVKQTDSYKRNNDAINHKISFLTLLHERRKNKNTVLMNILLYVLSYIGGISALEVLHNQFCWPFKPMAIILSVVFISLGIYWVWHERKK